jgi:xylose dehydrogenase (NAD/NADP)
MSPPLRWGLLSTASIGVNVIEATRPSTRAEFVAVASRDAGKARRYADRLDLPESYGSYEELLDSDTVDAIYVALPVSLHTEWTVKALQAGKHVLCEKPFATTAADARRAFDVARAMGLGCAEGFMYRYHPQTTLVRQLLDQGAIGQLRHARAALSITAPPGDIRMTQSLGGGALNDLGGYCVSALRLFAGSPERVYAEGLYQPDGLDLRMSAMMRFAGGVTGQFDIGLDLPRRDELELIGSAGVITVRDPWICRSITVQLRTARGVVHLPVPFTGVDLTAEQAQPGSAAFDDAVYRIELDQVSAAFAAGTELPFGRDDAIEQAALLEILRTSAATASPLAPAAGPERTGIDLGGREKSRR